MNASELFKAGQLTEAIAAASEEVRHAPRDCDRRYLLAELFALDGQTERADKQLETIAQQEPKAAMQVAVFRQLLRAAHAREQFFNEGRLPEFLSPPPPHVQAMLAASIRLRERQPAEAAKLLEEGQVERPTVRGTCAGEAFEGLRDLDDLLYGVFEVLTTTGKYYWIPMERVESIEFRPPQRPRDLLWRPARMIVAAGPDGEVFLPVLYPGAQSETDSALRLGRSTDWRQAEGGPVRGVGQRVYLVGEIDRPILELKDLALVTAEENDGETAR